MKYTLGQVFETYKGDRLVISHISPGLPGEYDLYILYSDLADPTSPGAVMGEMTIDHQIMIKSLFLVSEPKDSLCKQNIFKHDHSEHMIVNSMADGKNFKYCRDCKVEVLLEENRS